MTKVRSRVKGTASTKEVVLSMEIVSFPVGGTMTLIAWGRTILRRIWPRLMPRAPAASL